MASYSFETEEHTALREQARRWAAREMAPHALAWDIAGEFPRALYKSAAEAGLLGISYPEALGGGGGDLGHAIVVAEEKVLAGHSVGALVSLGSLGIALPPLIKLGTADQHARFVTPVLRGELISALAITEPGAGSDVASLTTRGGVRAGSGGPPPCATGTKKSTSRPRLAAISGGSG